MSSLLRLVAQMKVPKCKLGYISNTIVLLAVVTVLNFQGKFTVSNLWLFNQNAVSI